MEIRLSLKEPLKSKLLNRMVKAGTTSARAVVLQILEETLLRKPSPSKTAK